MACACNNNNTSTSNSNNSSRNKFLLAEKKDWFLLFVLLLLVVVVISIFSFIFRLYFYIPHRRLFFFFFFFFIFLFIVYTSIWHESEGNWTSNGCIHQKKENTVYMCLTWEFIFIEDDMNWVECVCMMIMMSYNRLHFCRVVYIIREFHFCLATEFFPTFPLVRKCEWRMFSCRERCVSFI